jgi:hypothetical protein
MSKKCAKCDKTVYPAEELKCLDKFWHKGCFKCWECGMTLTMKNYKGYDKLPYCSAHYPQTKATVVADTPEQRRLAQTSHMQSQVAYHADFEKNIKGTMTSMADDPETKRVREIANVVSQASYKGRGSESDAPEGYQRQESYENREQRSSYVPPHNPNMPSNRMLPVQQPPPQMPAPQMPVPQQQINRQPAPPAAPPVVPSGGPVYIAMYDYDAQDDDEVSFQENDRIVNCESIDEGWVVGTVERTNQRGMIPANYIERP